MFCPIANSAAAPPNTLILGQRQWPIETDFRRWIHFWRVMSADDLTVFEKQNIALLNTFGEIQEDVEGAMEVAIRFYLCGKDCGEGGSLPRERLLDWDADWLCVWADFRMYAGIDLDIEKLHWWRFMALFESLPKESGIKRRISIRAVDIGEIGDAKLREEYRRMKEAVTLEEGEEDWEGFYERAASI